MLLVLATTVSCSKLSDGDLSTKAAESAAFSFDEVLSKWSTYKSLSEKFGATQMPEALPAQLSTEELLRITLSHPLMAIYIAHNNQLYGIRLFCNNFNGVQEMLKREDAEEVILEFLPSIGLDYFAVPFLEYLLGTELIQTRNPSLKSKYKEVISYCSQFEELSTMITSSNYYLNVFMNELWQNGEADPDTIYYKVRFGQL